MSPVSRYMFFFTLRTHYAINYPLASISLYRVYAIFPCEVLTDEFSRRGVVAVGADLLLDSARQRRRLLGLVQHHQQLLRALLQRRLVHWKLYFLWATAFWLNAQWLNKHKPTPICSNLHQFHLTKNYTCKEKVRQSTKSACVSPRAGSASICGIGTFSKARRASFES